MLNVVRPDQRYSACQCRISKIMRSVQPLENYWIIVGRKVFKQQVVLPGEDNKGFPAEQMKQIQLTPVIMNPQTFTLQGARAAAPVTEAVKYHAHTLLLQRGYLVKYIRYAAIIWRVGYIEAYKVYNSVAGGFVHEE